MNICLFCVINNCLVLSSVLTHLDFIHSQMADVYPQAYICLRRYDFTIAMISGNVITIFFCLMKNQLIQLGNEIISTEKFRISKFVSDMISKQISGVVAITLIYWACYNPDNQYIDIQNVLLKYFCGISGVFRIY